MDPNLYQILMAVIALAAFFVLVLLSVKFMDPRPDIKKLCAFIFSALDLRDICAFGGLGLIGHGLGLIYQPAAFLAIGAGLWWLGVRRIGTNLKAGTTGNNAGGDSAS